MHIGNIGDHIYWAYKILIWGGGKNNIYENYLKTSYRRLLRFVTLLKIEATKK